MPDVHIYPFSPADLLPRGVSVAELKRQLEILGINIRRERTNLGLSQKDLASKAGISLDTLGRIERGGEGDDIQLGTIEKIARELKSPLTVLLQDHGTTMDADESDVINQNIHRLLKERKMSPVVLAKTSDIEFGTIKNYLSGHRSPGPKNLIKIAKAFGVQPSQMRLTPEAWRQANEAIEATHQTRQDTVDEKISRATQEIREEFAEIKDLLLKSLLKK